MHLNLHHQVSWLQSRHWRFQCSKPRSCVAVQSASQSIRDFIRNECPVQGIDGRFRERSREATITGSLLAIEQTQLVSPGCQLIERVSPTYLERVLENKGQVLLTVLDNAAAAETSAPAMPLNPPKGGSYTSLGQVLGVQRLPGGGFIRVAVEERATIQALCGQGTDDASATAALLPDRWVYYVRATAIQEALKAGPGAAAARDVAYAVASCLDVASELHVSLSSLHKAASRILEHCEAQGKQEGVEQLQDAMDELDRLLDWCGVDGLLDDGGSSSSSNDYSFSSLQRLSYAPFAASCIASCSGIAISELNQQRTRAMEATDLGLRLEQALDWCQHMQGAMAVRSALLPL